MYVNISSEIFEILEDYHIHQTKYDDDFKTFLSKHFGELKLIHQKEHQKEHQEHNHHHNTNEINVQFDFICSRDFFSLPQKITIISCKNNFYYKSLFSTFEKQKIFQPPRV